MKKVILLVTAVSLAVSFTSCKNKSKQETTGVTDSIVALSTEEDTTEEETTTQEGTTEEYAAEQSSTAPIVQESSQSETVKVANKTVKANTTIQPPIPTVPPEPQKLSEDLYSFQFQIAGDIIQVPIMVSQLMELGWGIEGDPPKVIDPSDSKNIKFKKGEAIVSASVVNRGEKAMPINQLSIISFFLSKESTEVIMPKNIVLLKSTDRNVRSEYGKEIDHHVGDGVGYIILVYKLNDFQEIRFTYYPISPIHEDEVIIQSITIYNDLETSSKAISELENFEPSPEALAYKAPTEFGSDLTSLIFNFEGDLYQYPAPVSAFVENGWTIMPTLYNKTAVAENRRVTLLRNGKAVSFNVKNYGTDTTSVHNCFTESLYTYNNLPDISYFLANGITVGKSSKEDVLKALEGKNYTIQYDERYDHYEIYTAYNKDGTHKIEIKIDKSGGNIVDTMLLE